jgi:hypothetical protein
MKRISIIIPLVFIVINVLGQIYVPVVNQTITVNSRSTLSGNSRNYIVAEFPKNTSAYVYRISITSKDASTESTELFNLLKNYPSATIAIGSQLTQLIIQTSDGKAVDAFTFNNVYDADNFRNKNDGNWGASQASMSVVNTCYASNTGLNPTVYFGFRNNNLMDGLNVHLEVVAIVDSAKQSNTCFSYSILNGTDRELKYFISTDESNWQEANLESLYSQTFSSGLPYFFFKIYTNTFNFVSYKITPTDRYKIILNNGNKWDLIKY